MVVPTVRASHTQPPLMLHPMSRYLRHQPVSPVLLEFQGNDRAVLQVGQALEFLHGVVEPAHEKQPDGHAVGQSIHLPTHGRMIRPRTLLSRSVLQEVNKTV